MSDRIIKDEQNPHWRVLESGLYKIQPKEGGAFIPFIANYPQRVLHFLGEGSVSMEDFITDVVGHRKSKHTDWLEEVLPKIYPEAIVKQPHYNVFILKGRQLGITTYYYITELDDCLFRPGTTVGIIHINDDRARKQLKSRILKVYQKLPSDLRSVVRITYNSSEINFSNESTLYCAARMRGETLNKLHVSEFAPKAYFDPKSAKEVLTGSMEAVRVGKFGERVNRVINETTMSDHADIALQVAQQALKNTKNRVEDVTRPKMIFLPFYLEETYVSEYGSDLEHLPASQKLMLLLERSGVFLRAEQKNFLFMKQENLGSVERRLEYPVYETEALDAPSTSSVWYHELQDLQDKGDYIIPNLFDKRHALHLAWDVGYKDLAAVIAFQSGIGEDGLRWFHFIKGEEFERLDTEAYTTKCQELFQQYHEAPRGFVIFPIDAKSPAKKGTSPIFDTTQMALMGADCIVTTVDYMLLADGHAEMRKHFPRFKFNSTHGMLNSGTGVLARLSQYQWKPDRQSDLRSNTVDNEARNMADAIRYGVCMAPRLSQFDAGQKAPEMLLKSPLYAS